MGDVVVVAVMVVAVGLSDLVGTQGQKRGPSWKVLPENPWEAKAILSDRVTGNRVRQQFSNPLIQRMENVFRLFRY